MDTINPETQDLLAKLEQSRSRRQSLQNLLSGAFMTAIVVLMVLLTLFNVYALNRLQSQTADLRSTVLVKQRLDANASANSAEYSTRLGIPCQPTQASSAPNNLASPRPKPSRRRKRR